MKKLVTKVGLINSVGTVGYLIGVLGWLLLASIVVMLLVASNIIVTPQDTTVITDTSTQPATPLVVGSYLLTGIMVIVTIGVLVTLPYLIGKWSSRLMRRILKIVRIAESRNSLFLTKCIAVSLPMIGFLGIQLWLDPGTIVFGALHAFTVVTAILAIVCFVIQLLFARRFKLSGSSIW